MKKKVIVGISLTIILLFIVIILFYVKNLYKDPPKLYAKIEGRDYVECRKGGYEWTSGLIFKETRIADAAHVTQMEYSNDNIVYVKPGQKITFENRGYGDNNKGIVFSKEDARCFNQNNIDEEIKLLEDKNANNSEEIIVKSPNEEGIYFFSIIMSYGKRGKVEYGLKVIVSTEDISYKTFIGNVIEVKEAGEYVVKPIEGQEILKSVDKISIKINFVRGFKLGDKVKVTYTGEIMETYPAKVDVINASIYKEYNTSSSYIPLKDLPEDYSIESAIEEHCCVITNTEGICNQVLMDLFVSSVEENNTGFVRVINFTMEGDMIISDVQFENGIFTVLHDSRRDEFSAKEDRVIKEYTFNSYEYMESDYAKYLSLFNMADGVRNEECINIPISLK